MGRVMAGQDTDAYRRCIYIVSFSMMREIKIDSDQLMRGCDVIVERAIQFASSSYYYYSYCRYNRVYTYALRIKYTLSTLLTAAMFQRKKLRHWQPRSKRACGAITPSGPSTLFTHWTTSSIASLNGSGGAIGLCQTGFCLVLRLRWP